MKITKILWMAGVIFMLTGTVYAGDISLNAARIGGKNVEALAKFYDAAFGLKEVNRLKFPGGVEIMMNFGATVAQAKANQAAQVVIMPRPATDGVDSVSHIVFNVKDVKAVAAAVKAAGGTMAREPIPFGDTGMFIGFAADPEGNQIELIQHP